MKIWVVMLFLLAASTVYGGESIGKITNLVVNRYDEVLVEAGVINGSPECATENRFVADLNTDHGRAMYSMMLTAQAQGKEIRIVGQNICNIRVDYESIQFVGIYE